MIKKIIISLILGIILLFVARSIKLHFFDDRPIKFEFYNGEIESSKAFEKEIIRMFPVGTNVYDAIKVIEQSGAKCKTRSIKKGEYPYKRPMASHITGCHYTAYFFSVDPIINYYIDLQSDKNNLIIYFDAGAIGGAFVI